MLGLVGLTAGPAHAWSATHGARGSFTLGMAIKEVWWCWWWWWWCDQWLSLVCRESSIVWRADSGRQEHLPS